MKTAAAAVKAFLIDLSSPRLAPNTSEVFFLKSFLGKQNKCFFALTNRIGPTQKTQQQPISSYVGILFGKRPFLPPSFLSFAIAASSSIQYQLLIFCGGGDGDSLTSISPPQIRGYISYPFLAVLNRQSPPPPPPPIHQYIGSGGGGGRIRRDRKCRCLRELVRRKRKSPSY